MVTVQNFHIFSDINLINSGMLINSDI